MGYSGLDSWVYSDRAADLMYDLIDNGKFIKKLEKGLKLKENEFNTNGIINDGRW